VSSSAAARGRLRGRAVHGFVFLEFAKRGDPRLGTSVSEERFIDSLVGLFFDFFSLSVSTSFQRVLRGGERADFFFSNVSLSKALLFFSLGNKNDLVIAFFVLDESKKPLVEQTTRSQRSRSNSKPKQTLKGVSIRLWKSKNESTTNEKTNRRLQTSHSRFRSFYCLDRL